MRIEDVDDQTQTGPLSWDERVARHDAVSAALAALDDAAVTALLDEASPPAAGIGGTTSRITVAGVPVFVKRVPLTDREQRPENVGSTANLFRLPTFYQYGIGSAGFGAWREVAVHTMTTRWVLDRRAHCFPLLHHRRVLPQPPSRPDPAEQERWVRHWDGDDAVRARLQAISAASAGVVLFMEHLPFTVDTWLTARTAAGDGTAGEAYAMVLEGLRSGVSFMRARGLTHFDAHFRNLLTDGRRIYFADFGLANHRGFDLDPAEAVFLRRHRDYDDGYTVTHLTQWLVSTLLRIPWTGSLDRVRAHAADLDRLGLPAAAARIVARHAPVALLMDDFYRELVHTSRRTPFPADSLGRALRR